MIPSSRIRVARAPLARKDLESAEGRVISLVPRACNPLRYRVAIQKKAESSGQQSAENADFETLELPSPSLQLLDYEGDDDASDDMLVVNTLCYCRKHRLESCGSCGFEFRVGNLIKELGGDVDAGMRLDEEIMSMMRNGAWSVRRAPPKNLEIEPFDLYTAIINDAITTIPNGLDIIQLDDFPRNKQLVNSFESQFLLDIRAQRCEEPTQRPLYCVRKLFTTVGLYLDHAIQGQTALPRIILQDDAQSEILIMDITAIKLFVGDFAFAPGMKWRMPIIAVAWSRVKSGDVQDLAASFAKIPRNTPIEQIRATPYQIELFAKIIAANAALMSPESLDFFKTVVMRDQPTSNVGVIAPISTKAQEGYYNLLGDHCEYCTASECRLFRCGRCRSVHYCSRACQKASWKKHRSSCRSR